MRQGEPLHAALERDFKAGQRLHGISAESVATDFGKSPEWLYKLLHGIGALVREMKQIVAWHQSTGGIEALKWLAAECGCLVVPRPKCRSTHKKLAAVIQEFGDVVKRHGECEEDGTWTASEFAQMDREIEELLAAVCDYREHLRGRVQQNGRAATLRETQHV